MNLATLKTHLATITGTSIGEVIFDWKTYLNKERERTYPIVFWSMDNTSFVKDKRTTTVQKVDRFTITCFIVTAYNPDDSIITVYDTMEGYFDTYLTKLNAQANIQIENINEIKGQYVAEGLMGPSNEIAIMFKDVEVKAFCNS